ncbi:MAG: O-antigen ligase family protein [Methylacidiphilales bacterium]|nr:O-antigen ligase family protein [Candidatus Methylacidiphilales bacterium]MDW8349339.1 O-antigen ligase family protein [Verrucomicrobiae bacterium]
METSSNSDFQTTDYEERRQGESHGGKRERKRQRRRNDTGASLATAIWVGVILAIGPLVLGGARPWIWLPVLGLGIGLFVFQWIRLWQARESLSYRPDWADGAVLAFVFYAGLRYWTAPVEYEARQEWMNILMYAGLYGVCRYGFKRTWHGLLVMGIVLGVACGVALFGFWLKANMDFLPYGEKLHQYYAPRLVGTYGCPNHAGALFYLAIPIAVGFCLFAERYSWPIRIVVGFLGFVVLPTALLLTLSRGSYLALGVVGVVGLIFLVRLTVVPWWVLVGFLVAGGMGGVLFVLNSEAMAPRLAEVQNVIANNQWLSYVRVQLARDALLMFRDYPIFGSGPATFGLLHPRYHGDDYSTLAIYTHNDYLNLLTDYGLVGFLIVAVFIVSATGKLWKRLEWTDPWRLKVMRFAVSAGWAGILLHSFFDFNMHIQGNAAIVCALIGLGIRKSDEGYDEQSTSMVVSRVWLWVLLGLLIIFAYLWQITVRTYFPLESARRLMQGKPEPSQVQRAIELTRKSIQADPRNHHAAGFYGDLMRTQCALSENPQYREDLSKIALEAYSHAIRLNPLDDTLLVRKAMMFDLIKKYPEALELYQQAIRNQPHNGFFHNALGNHYWRTGNLEEALKAFEKADKAPYGQQDAAKAIQILRPIVEILKMP